MPQDDILTHNLEHRNQLMVLLYDDHWCCCQFHSILAMQMSEKMFIFWVTIEKYIEFRIRCVFMLFVFLLGVSHKGVILKYKTKFIAVYGMCFGFIYKLENIFWNAGVYNDIAFAFACEHKNTMRPGPWWNVFSDLVMLRTVPW